MTAQDQRDVGITTDYMLEGGAEVVTDALCAMFPGSTVYTSIADESSLPAYPAVARAHVEGRLQTGIAQRLWPLIRRVRSLSAYHFYWLCFTAAAFEKTRNHDLIFATCSAQSKLFRMPRSARVIVYFHTPTRWLYPGLMSEGDLAAIPRLQRYLISAFNLVLGPLDRLGVRRLKAHDPTWLCNSRYVRDAVRRFYGVDCKVIFPPINITRFEGILRQPQDFFLYHGRLTYQKRVDVAIRACLLARRKLVISGQATDPRLEAHLHAIVTEAERTDPTLKGLITFLGRTTDDQLRTLFATCRALVFPPREDFGLTPIEAITSGVPVIAYREGGALDYVRPGVNGCFFERQEGDSLAKVLTRFDPADFPAEVVTASLPDLSEDRFRREIRAVLETAG